jgi:hypothetical protein
MQKFFRDKPKLFECNISVDGAKISETKARLILEFPDTHRNLLFYGNLDNNGKCEITIPALKEYDETEGNVILEVIAESTHFESWRDKFKLETNKKIQVEMVEPKKEIIINNIKPHVEIINEDIEEIKEEVIVENEIYNNFNKYINENKIKINDIVKNKTKFFNLLSEYKKKSNNSKENIILIVEEIKSRINNKKSLLNS